MTAYNKRRLSSYPSPSIGMVALPVLTYIIWRGRLPHNPQQPSHYDDIVTNTPQQATKTAKFKRKLQHLFKRKSARPLPTQVKSLSGENITAALQQLTLDHPQLTGIYPLEQGMDAFAARLILAATAQKTLDIQYYIWEADVTGTLLFQALKHAADRGVRIRLLLDDNNSKGLDAILLTLNRHPNVEIRLYNPNMYRNLRFFGFLGHFVRLNRRMHNKSFTADNQISITGGRNIGDEYFAVEGNMLFADLDTLLIGKIVPKISQDFDAYWNSPLAYPVDSIVTGKAASPEVVDRLLAKQRAHNRQFQAIEIRYLKSLQQLDFIHQLRDATLPLYWAEAELISDTPKKTLAGAVKAELMSQKLTDAMGKPQFRLNIVSPYFVPTRRGAKQLIKLKQQGIDVQVLTNAMTATDVKVVHSGYAKYRKRLLKHGIAIYELKPNGPVVKMRDSYITGDTGNSLHAKTFEIDGKRIFIGSYNLDPRSATLNTEMGVVVHSEKLAQNIVAGLDEWLPTQSYQLTLNKHHIEWTTLDKGKPITYRNEPQTYAWERGMIWLLMKLPIEWLL